MRRTEDIMGMPVSVEIVGADDREADRAFQYFREVDQRFSTYKEDSEISRINRGEIAPDAYSADMQEVLRLSEETKELCGGWFDIRTPAGTLDPSGLVKGWAIRNAANMLREHGHQNFYVEAGGDIQTGGVNAEGAPWRLGIRNPFKNGEVVKVVVPNGKGIATSGSYVRGLHIYNPHTGEAVESNVVSLTVIGPDVYEADRFATAAFAMGERGISFIEQLDGFEAYAIDRSGLATETSGFGHYVYENDR